MKRIPIILAMIFFAFAAFASFDWKTVKTEEFEVFYKPGYEKRALKLLSSLDYFKNIPEKITGSKKTGIPVLLEDFGISAPRGGCANPVYYVMSITNDPGKEAFRMPLVGAHEYTHMLHLTRSEGLPSLFTFLFGGAFAPPLISPGWAIEGITTYTESKISKYSSRLNNGAYDSYIGACVAENEFPSVMKATYRPVEMPSYLSWYLFGGEFFDFLSKKYGEEKFAEFFEKYSWWPLSYFSPVLPVLGIDSVLGNVYGKPAEGLWEEWEEYERERFKDFKMQGQKITGHGWYSRYPVINSGFLYYNRVVVRKHAPFSTRAYSDIVRINTKNMKRKKIMSTTSSFTHPVVFAGGNVYYSIAETKGNYANTANYGFGSFAAVYEENPETGKKRKICEGRIRTFYADGNALYYAADKKDGFGSKIYSVGLDGLNKKHLFDTDYLILRFSNDGGVTVVEARKEGGNADLYFFDPENKSFREMVISPYS